MLYYFSQEKKEKEDRTERERERKREKKKLGECSITKVAQRFTKVSYTHTHTHTPSPCPALLFSPLKKFPLKNLTVSVLGQKTPFKSDSQFRKIFFQI